MSRFLFPLCICFVLPVFFAGCHKPGTLTGSQPSTPEEINPSIPSGIEVEGQPHSYIVTKYLD